MNKLSKSVLSLLIWNGEKGSFCNMFKLYDHQTLSKNSSLLLQKNRNNRLPQFFSMDADITVERSTTSLGPRTGWGTQESVSQHHIVRPEDWKNIRDKQEPETVPASLRCPALSFAFCRKLVVTKLSSACVQVHVQCVILVQYVFSRWAVLLAELTHRSPLDFFLLRSNVTVGAKGCLWSFRILIETRKITPSKYQSHSLASFTGRPMGYNL